MYWGQVESVPAPWPPPQAWVNEPDTLATLSVCLRLEDLRLTLGAPFNVCTLRPKDPGVLVDGLRALSEGCMQLKRLHLWSRNDAQPSEQDDDDNEEEVPALSLVLDELSRLPHLEEVSCSSVAPSPPAPLPHSSHLPCHRAAPAPRPELAASLPFPPSGTW